MIVCRAPAEKTHPVFHARWKEFSKDERRIRHLKGKDVFLMFAVSEGADNVQVTATVTTGILAQARSITRIHRFVGKQCGLGLTVFRDGNHNEGKIAFEIVDVGPFSR